VTVPVYPTLKYLDSEISGLGIPESSLRLYFAASASGPWTEVTTTTVDADKNELSFTSDGSSNSVVIAIGESSLIPMADVWVDFAAPGGGNGSLPSPYNTLAAGLAAVAAGGTVNIQGGVSAETFTGGQVINQHVIINAVSGTVTIGGPSRSAGDKDDDSGEAGELGFVSRLRK